MSKWVKANLSDVTDITMGQSPDSASYNEVGFGYPFLQGCADFGKRYPKARIFCSDAKKIGRKDSVLISVRAPVGELNLADKDYCVGRGVSAICPRKVNRDFLFNSLLLNKRLFYRVSQGSTFEAINSNDLNSFSIDYPDDMASQNKIARILNTIDVVIEQTELTIEKLKSIKQGMMHDLFTRGIDLKTGQLRPPQSEEPELYKNTELGWIPKDWDVVAVKDFGSVVTGNTPSKNNISNWGNDFLWASPFDFCEKYIYATQTFLSNDGKKCARIVPAGTVLITCIASLGKNAIAAFEMAFNQQINAVIINRDNDNEYFYYNISNDGIRFSALAGQTAVPIINKTTFEKFKLTRALLPEQKLIADRISNADEHLLKTKKELNKYEKLKQGLMQDLLTGKVSVVPDTQDKEYQGAN